LRAASPGRGSGAGAAGFAAGGSAGDGAAGAGGGSPAALGALMPDIMIVPLNFAFCFGTASSKPQATHFSA
jgi:hypothetical protein